MTEKNTAQAPQFSLGTPGLITKVAVVPHFGEKGNDSHSSQRLNDLSSREFRVSGRLAISNEIKGTNININFDERSGDSLLTLSGGAAKFRSTIFDGDIMLFTNSENRISAIQIDCTAKSITEAHSTFNKVVSPMLDHLSYIGKIPLQIVQVTVVDQMHKISLTEIITPYYLTTTLNHGTVNIFPMLEPVYALYRESRNAQSPFYKFLCLYKILEGLLKTLRSKIYKEAKGKNVTLPPLLAKVPIISDIPEDQEKYFGKSITFFFDDYLTKQFRDVVAHFMLTDGSILNINEIYDIQRYWGVIYLTELCCQEVISHFEQCIGIFELAYKTPEQ